MKAVVCTSLSLVGLWLAPVGLFAADLVVSGTSMVIDTDTDIDGSIYVENGGTLTIRDATVTLELDYDEEHHVDVAGSSRLVIDNAEIRSVGGQFWFELYSDDTGSPTLEVSGADTWLTNHSGIRPFDDTTITITGGDVEELQLRDRVTVDMRDAAAYMVFFFDGETVTIDGLDTGTGLEKTINVPGGWSFTMENSWVEGYQIDLMNGADVTVNDGDGIVLSVHTPGNLGSGLNIVEGLTADSPISGSMTNLGSQFHFTNCNMALFNAYVFGTDRVLLRGMHVNEVNAEDRSELIIGQAGYTTPLNCNLCQVYDSASFTVEHAVIDDSENVPSATASYHDIAEWGYGVMTFREMDLRDLFLTVLENGTMNLHNCLYDPAKLQVLDATATFNNYGLAVDFSATPTTGPAPLAVQFSDASSGQATGWSWDFGDGETASQQDPMHTYAGAGTYDVSLSVTGPAGLNGVVKEDYITVTSGSAGECSTDSETLCLNGSRFRVKASYATAQGQSDTAQAVHLTDDTGYLWFFNENNVEVVIKVLKACGVNNRYWVFAGGLTDVAVTLTVEDTRNGSVKTYTNPQQTPFAPIQDTSAFATCP